MSDTRSDTRDPMAAGLPGNLTAEFTAVRILRADDHATVTIIQHRATRQFKVVKIYHAADRLAEDLSSPWSGADPRCVLPVERSIEEVDGKARLVELMEYLPHGSIADVLKTTSRPGRPALARDLLGQVSAALEHIHTDLGIAHGAINSNNVLFHSVAPTISVLANQAPETLDSGDADPAHDWWALGVLLFEVLTGQHPCAGVRKAFSARSLDLSALPDRRWSPLIRGLLEHDTAGRWGAEQIREWRRGRSPDVVGVVRRPQTISRRTVPFVFAGQYIDDPSALAFAMRENWHAAAQAFSDAEWCQELRTWIKRDVRDNQISDDCLKVATGSESVDAQIIAFSSHYLGGDDPQLRGETATARTLAQRFSDVGASWSSDPLLFALTPKVASSLANARRNDGVRLALQHPDFTAFARYAKHVAEGDELITSVFSRIAGATHDREIRGTQAMMRAALLSEEIAAAVTSASLNEPQTRWQVELHQAAASAQGPTKTILEVIYSQTQALPHTDGEQTHVRARAPKKVPGTKPSVIRLRRPRLRRIAVPAAAIVIGIGVVSFVSTTFEKSETTGESAVSDVPAQIEPGPCGPGRTITVTDAESGAVVNVWTLTREVADAGTAACNQVSLTRDSQQMSTHVLPPGMTYIDGGDGLWTYLDGTESQPADLTVSTRDLPRTWLIARTTDGRAISANLAEGVLGFLSRSPHIIIGARM